MESGTEPRKAALLAALGIALGKPQSNEAPNAVESLSDLPPGTENCRPFGQHRDHSRATELNGCGRRRNRCEERLERDLPRKPVREALRAAGGTAASA